MVKIERVNGTTSAPAKVRMLTLSNVKHKPGEVPMPISHYPSGVKILLELIGAAEDINRYDFFVIKGEGEYVAPNTPVEVEAYPKESYMNRIRWIWSRKAEQVVFTKEVQDYVIACSDELNKSFSSHIQFLGREGWKKLSRISIAVAACVCSFDETGENLKVTPEHVKWAKNFLKACYGNELFNLERHVKEERAFDECDPSDIQAMQGMYNRNAALITQMERSTGVTMAQMRSMAGGDQNDFTKLYSRLTECNFIHQEEKVVRASGKFRKAFKMINKNTTMKRV
jgi:hypothetical protein